MSAEQEKDGMRVLWEEERAEVLRLRSYTKGLHVQLAAALAAKEKAEAFVKFLQDSTRQGVVDQLKADLAAETARADSAIEAQGKLMRENDELRARISALRGDYAAAEEEIERLKADEEGNLEVILPAINP